MRQQWTAFYSAEMGGGLGANENDYQTGFQLWRGRQSGFDGWRLNGVHRSADGSALVLDGVDLPEAVDEAGAYQGGNYYNGGAYQWGEAVSPELKTGFAVQQAIPSWNADTPPGTWIETLVRARMGERWSKWYSLGVWAAGDETVRRHSVSAQGDEDGSVSVDTLVLARGSQPAQALQVKVRMMRAAGSASTPTLHSLSLAYAARAPKQPVLSAGSPANWNVRLPVPACSQMVYPDGGNVWCSPTSVAMVLRYWDTDEYPSEPCVRHAVRGVYDWVYDAHGNWPFNTAYAASQKLPTGERIEGYVARFNSLNHLENWVKAGVPVVMSIAWGENDLSGAAIPSSNGHLVVLVGFDPAGDPIVNDPAASSDAGVQRIYRRGEFETVWLTRSGGAAYLIFPSGYGTPEM